MQLIKVIIISFFVFNNTLIFAQDSFDPSKAITSGKASVTIYREGKVAVVPDGDNFDVAVDSVVLNEVQIATIKNKSFYTAEFDSGEQVLVSTSRNAQTYANKNIIKLSLEADERYFV